MKIVHTTITALTDVTKKRKSKSCKHGIQSESRAKRSEMKKKMENTHAVGAVEPRKSDCNSQRVSSN